MKVPIPVNKTNHLSLQGSDCITPVGWQRFAKCLRKNSTLVYLDISRCDNWEDDEERSGLDDEVANGIGESLAMNTTLKKLDMSHNTEITYDGWIKLSVAVAAASLGQNTTINQ